MKISTTGEAQQRRCMKKSGWSSSFFTDIGGKPPQNRPIDGGNPFTSPMYFSQLWREKHTFQTLKNHLHIGHAWIGVHSLSKYRGSELQYRDSDHTDHEHLWTIIPNRLDQKLSHSHLLWTRCFGYIWICTWWEAHVDPQVPNNIFPKNHLWFTIHTANKKWHDIPIWLPVICQVPQAVMRSTSWSQ